MRLLDERKRGDFPDALLFGISFVGQLILAFTKENYPFNYTPASIVSQNMLNKGFPNNFESAMELRQEERTGSFDVDPEEIQGYIDSITLYMAACFTQENDLPETLMGESLDVLPIFTQLPIQARIRSEKFITQNGRWATRELLPSDLEDGKRLMNSLAQRVEAHAHNQPYQRGARTARDTLLLYVELIQAFLTGKLG